MARCAALAGLWLLAACSPAPPHPAAPVVVTVRIAQNGTVLWNGRAVDPATLDRLLDDAARQKPQPQVHLEPDRHANYDAVAGFMALAMRKGVHHLGFTGIEAMP